MIALLIFIARLHAKLCTAMQWYSNSVRPFFRHNPVLFKSIYTIYKYSLNFSLMVVLLRKQPKHIRKCEIRNGHR